MSDLKQLRNRVRSIKSTQKITRAMHVVSASKLKKVKEIAESTNEYSIVLRNVMCDISTHGNLAELAEKDRRFFSSKLKKMPHLFIVMTSERGLCGGFNSSVIKRVEREIKKFQLKGKVIKLLVVGQKGYDALFPKYEDMIIKYYHNTKENNEFISRNIKEKVIQMVENEEVGACYMYYNKFKNAMKQILTEEQILPVKPSEDVESISEYEYEGENLVHDVINLYIGSQVNYGILQSRASEEGARMTAMDNATKNATELIDKLTLKLNRSRQAMITTELTEIIAGAESL